MAHHTAPPIIIGSWDHPHAFTNIPKTPRPTWGSSPCVACSGRGRRNATFFPDSFRCIVTCCASCDGSGWISADGRRHLPDIETVDGRPGWIVRTIPAAPTPCGIQDLGNERTDIAA